jgi:methionine-R-sulfoxide reductase
MSDKKKTTSLDIQRKKLTPLQFEVTQNCGTEAPFANEYWNNKREGIYVDIVSGEPLFSSKDKYDSGTGWPSFYEPVSRLNIIEQPDISLGMIRTEVLCARCGGPEHDRHRDDCVR